MYALRAYTFLACAGVPAGQRTRNFGGKVQRTEQRTEDTESWENSTRKNVYSSPGSNSTRQQCRKWTWTVWWRWSFQSSSSITSTVPATRRRSAKPRWRRRSGCWRQERTEQKTTSEQIAEAETRWSSVRDFVCIIIVFGGPQREEERWLMLGFTRLEATSTVFNR